MTKLVLTFGKDSLDAATRWNVKIAMHFSFYIYELPLSIEEWKDADDSIYERTVKIYERGKM